MVLRPGVLGNTVASFFKRLLLQQAGHWPSREGKLATRWCRFGDSSFLPMH
jgi:hypothetical protein